jgi:hypothetical protein
LLHRNFAGVYTHSRRDQVRAFVLYGHRTRVVTSLHLIILMQDIHKTSLNAGFCSKLCLNLFYCSETEVRQMNGRRPDHRQVEVPYGSYAWLLLLKLHVRLGLNDFGLLLPVFYITLSSMCRNNQYQHQGIHLGPPNKETIYGMSPQQQTTECLFVNVTAYSHFSQC